MKRIVTSRLSRKFAAVSLGFAVFVAGVTGCRSSTLPRMEDGAVIRDPITTTTAAKVETFPLPNDYYFIGNYLQDKIATINELLADSGENGEAFVYITDPHTDDEDNAGQTPSLVNYLCKQVALSRTVIGGDVASGPSSSYVSTMAKAFTDGAVHYVMGKYEYRSGVTDADLSILYQSEDAGEIGNLDRHYYYVDSPENKLRYVVLNGWAENCSFAEDIDLQCEWLKNEALQVQEGWGILVFAHQFVNSSWTESNDLRGFGLTWIPVARTLLEYEGDGEILAVFHGYRHQDMISRMRLGTNAEGNPTPVLDDNCGGIPLIGTAADKYQPDEGNYPYEILVDREAGTVTEQAFDVVVVDREHGKIHCVRIGAPARDKSGRPDQELVEIRTVNIRE